MKGLIFVTLVTLLNSQTALVTEAQNQKWKIHLSPDKTFSVMVPKATSVQPPHEKFRTCTIGERGLEGALRETIPRETRFGVIVINGRAEILRSLTRQKALEHLGLRFIGDDDEARFLRLGQKVRMRGLVGHEYFYIRDSEIPLFARGRIFDTGKQSMSRSSERAI